MSSKTGIHSQYGANQVESNRPLSVTDQCTNCIHFVDDPVGMLAGGCMANLGSVRTLLAEHPQNVHVVCTAVREVK